MFSNSSKDGIQVQTMEEFKKVDLDFLQERYDRDLWTVQEWEQIIGRKRNRPYHINRLYIDGSGAFFYGY
ncbi:MAG: hypothetical protein ACFFCQ_09875 [Promethearchaeota archaeon]